MTSSPKRREGPDRDSLSVELGGWFKAHATGRGVLAIPLLVALLVAAGLFKGFLG